MVSELLRDVPIPRMFRVRQVFDGTCIAPAQIDGRIRALFDAAPARERLKRGMRIAITAGSRGIANIDVITKSIVDCVRRAGCEPFIVAAMGSHGGATSEGQRAILDNLGVTERRMGCPIQSSMDVVRIGRNDEGGDVYIARDAAEADGIILNCRIKPHTCFRGPYESGMMKMMAIGLGKQIGADTCHRAGFQNMAKNVPLYGRAVLQNANVLFAVAILENAFEQTAELTLVDRDDMERAEPRLLERAKALLPRIHVDRCDVLVCDIIGKNFSGGGMDANITGTFVTPYCHGGLQSQRVAVLDLSPESHHNGTGCGMAHATTRRFFDKMDFEQTYPNVITSTVIENVRIPMVLQNDREAIQVCIRTCTDVADDGIRIVRIANSTQIGHILLSEAYYKEAMENPHLAVETEPMDLPFDADGNLTDLGRIG